MTQHPLRVKADSQGKKKKERNRIMSPGQTSQSGTVPNKLEHTLNLNTHPHARIHTHACMHTCVCVFMHKPNEKERKGLSGKSNRRVLS